MMSKKNFWSLLSVLVIISLATTACGAEVRRVSQAFCVAVMSRNNNSSKFYWPEQVLPDSPADTLAGESLLYIPCGYRNYIVDNRGISNPNQQDTTLGDNTQLFRVVLPSGIAVNIGVKADWQLNQGRDELAEFIKFQTKYGALKDSMSDEGNVNSSTPGWNRMLLEVVWPTLDGAARQAMSDLVRNPTLDENGNPIIINDDFWRTADAAQWKAFGDKMSELFADELRSNIALANTNEAKTIDIMCGSGAPTGWVDSEKRPITNPDQAGQPGTTYNCAPVRIKVTIVEPAEKQVDTGSQSQIEANKAKWLANYELYHEQTDCWTGILDAIAACGQTPNCTVILDGSVCKDLNGNPASDTLRLPLNFIQQYNQPIATSEPVATPIP